MVRAARAMSLKTHRSARNFSAEALCGFTNDIFRKRKRNVRNRPAINATEMCVRRSGRFIVGAVRARKGDLGDESHVAETSECPIDSSKSDAGPPRPCEFVEFGHGKVASNPLLLDDIVN